MPKRDKPRGELESENRIAMLLLGQRPPHYAGVGRSCSIAEAIRWEMRACDLMLARSDTGAGQHCIVPFVSLCRWIVLQQQKNLQNFGGRDEVFVVVTRWHMESENPP